MGFEKVDGLFLILKAARDIRIAKLDFHMCSLNNLPKFKIRIKLVGRQKHLHFVSMFGFASCLGLNLQNIAKNSAQCTGLLKFHGFYVLKWTI